MANPVPAFDPNQPFQRMTPPPAQGQSAAPAFDPTQPFERPQATAAPAASPMAAAMGVEPSYTQKLLNGPVKGITNVLGFPGDTVAAMTNGVSPDTTEKMYEGSLSHAILGDTPMAREVFDTLSAVENAPKDALHAAGEYLGSENLRKPLRNFGVIPEDPNYKGGVADTLSEYTYGALAPEAGIASAAKAVGKGAVEAVPEIATMIGGLLPKSGVVGLGAGAGAEVAREAAPNHPSAELIAALLGAAVTHTASGAGGIISRLAKSAKGYVDQFTPEGQAQAAGARLNEAGVNTETATKAVSDATAVNDARPDGYKATTGTLIGEPGAIALEKAAVGDPKFSQRIQENNRAVGDNLSEATAPAEGAAPNDTKQFLNDQHAAALASHDTRLAQLEARLNEANSGVAQAQGTVSALGNTKQQASEDLAATLETQKKADTAVKSGKYEAASEAGASTQVDPTPFSEAATSIKDGISKLAQPAPELANILGDLERLTPKPGDISPVPGVKDANGGEIMQPAPTESITVKDLIAMRPRLSDAIKAAVKGKRGDISKPLQQIYDQFGAKLDDLAQAGDTGATAWRDAEENFKTEFAPKYREGVGAQLDKAERAQTPVPPTAVAGKLLKPNAAVGAQEAADQLTRIFQDAKGQGTTGQAAAQKSARQYLLGQMGDVVSGGKIEAARVESFMKNYSIAIDRVPGARQEMQQMLNRLKAGEKTTGQLEADLKTAQGEKKQTEGELNGSAASYYLTKDPEEAVNAVLNGEAKATGMKQLVDAAAKDPTGKAGKGLANTVKAVLNRRLRNPGSADLTTGADVNSGEVSDWAVSLAKAKAMLDKGTPERAALEAVLSPEDMAALDKTRNQLDITSRRSMKSTAGSDTSENESAKANQDVGGALAIGQNRGSGGVYNAVRSMIERRLGKYSPEKAINKLLVNAMLDPEAARVLAMKYTPSTSKVIERKIGTLIDGIAREVEGPADFKTGESVTQNLAKSAVPAVEKMGDQNDEPKKLADGDEEAARSQANFERNKPYTRAGAKDFATTLQPKQEEMFRKWVKANKVPFDPEAKDPQDYDMRGFYKAFMAGDKIAKSAIDPNDKRMHYPDNWKTPYHETFSNESQWATPDAPKWNDKDQLVDKSGKVIFDDRAKKPAN